MKALGAVVLIALAIVYSSTHKTTPTTVVEVADRFANIDLSNNVEGVVNLLWYHDHCHGTLYSEESKRFKRIIAEAPLSVVRKAGQVIENGLVTWDGEKNYCAILTEFYKKENRHLFQ